jgi:hypothetical protein
MKFYVTYKMYEEWNQFEGTWRKDWKSFLSRDRAERFIVSIWNNSNYKDISEVLTREFEA